MTKAGSISYEYEKDANGKIVGNIKNDGRYKYTWDALDQLTTVNDSAGNTIATYEYDENGRRIYSKVGTTETYYRYDGTSNQVLFETSEKGTVTKSYTYDETGHPLTMTYNGETYNYLTNYRGDVLTVTNASGNAVAEYTYDAWGNILTQSGTMASINPYRYAGYRYDEETKLYYLMARYYNPDTGVFLSLDPVRGDTMNPITMNGYNYANNNPMMNVDPDGEFSFNLTIKKTLRAFIKFLFKDFRQNTLTNIALILTGGSIGAWIARKAALKGFTMLNRQPNKKAVQGFIKGGMLAYVSGSMLSKGGDYIQRWVGKLWAYETWFDKNWLGKRIDNGLLKAEKYLLQKLK